MEYPQPYALLSKHEKTDEPPENKIYPGLANDKLHLKDKLSAASSHRKSLYTSSKVKVKHHGREEESIWTSTAV